MATIMFSTIGHAMGGPLGAAVGALAGGAVDSAVFGRRRGGGNLLVQRSAYGEVIPRLYGRTRTAGVIIWALPMKQGGSKGSGRKAYATSFAVALSSRRISGIGRIWADGSEIRNAEGQFSTDTRMRVYTGDGRQAADPIIVAAEGAGHTPAYQGLAYVVFEDFSVGAFGNRIPNLSFEVFADSDANIGNWLEDLAEGAGVSVVTDGTAVPGMVGYVAGREPWTDDVAALSRLADTQLRFSGGRLQLASGFRAIALPEVEVGASAGRQDSTSIRSIAAGDRPRSFTIDYFDPDRDYQAGRQHAHRGRSGNALVMQEPVVATASMARHIADRQLRRAEASVTTCEMTLSWRWLDLTVGDILTIGSRAEQWRVVRREVEDMLVRIVAEAVPYEPTIGQHEGDGGRALPAPVILYPPTNITVFEAPVSLREGVNGLGVWVAASGASGWQGAEIRWSAGNGEMLLGDIAMASPSGRLLTALPPGPANIWDDKADILLELDAADIPFESRSRTAVLAGANLLRVGEELLQFRAATPMGGNLFRLSGLLRGRYGTEQAVTSWPVGTPVQQLMPDRMLFLPMGADAIGRQVTIAAVGRGDPAGGTEAVQELEGQAVAPLAPVHVRARRMANGDITFSWVGRDRALFEWVSSSVVGGQIFVCRVRAVSGPQPVEISRRMSEGGFVYAFSEQVADFGEQLSDFEISIVVEGDGPEQVRATRWITMSV